LDRKRIKVRRARKFVELKQFAKRGLRSGNVLRVTISLPDHVARVFELKAVRGKISFKARCRAPGERRIRACSAFR
jgi:hypothetical protein